MKDEYDFANAEQGKFFVPVEEIKIPIFLDRDIAEYLNQKCGGTAAGLQVLVNDWLRKDIEIAKRISV